MTRQPLKVPSVLGGCITPRGGWPVGWDLHVQPAIVREDAVQLPQQDEGIRQVLKDVGKDDQVWRGRQLA